MLTREGYRTVTANDGEAGLNLAHELRPDLILLDLMMPGMDGFDFLDALHERGLDATVPVVAFTARELSQAEHDRLQGHARRVLEKGRCNHAELQTTVRQALAVKPG